MPTETTREPIQEAVTAGRALGRIDEQYRALSIAMRHVRKTEDKRDRALAEGNTHAGLIYARQAQTAQAIANEIDGVANDC